MIIQIDLPERLVRRAEAMIREGWIRDLDAVMAEALRRYLESHYSELTEEFIRDDVRWGLDGKE